MRVAVVDLGTNSTRLLVADVADGVLTEVERRTDVTRLGEGVDATGELAPAAVERVFAALERYRPAIASADVAVAVATSAVRDAANGAAFCAELGERFGLAARAISGEEEARLTFLGATDGRPADGETLVIDIGGGSTEYVTGVPGGPPAFHVSTRLGSVRQTERHLAHDPPLAAELAALAAEVRAVVEAEIPAAVRAGATRGIACAGTATSLAAIDQELDPYDSARVHGYELTLAAAERMLAMLAALPVVERRGVTGLLPERAPTIVAGVVILVESMRLFGLDRVEVCEHDILHGAALEAASGHP